MKKTYSFFFFLALITSFCFAQNTKTSIKALLIPENDQLAIQQKIVYVNTSTDSLNNIVLHNWPNSFKDRKTVLSKRMIENHKKSLYFADSIDKGSTTIHLVSANFKKQHTETTMKYLTYWKCCLKKN